MDRGDSRSRCGQRGALPQAKVPQEMPLSFSGSQDAKERVRQSTDIVDLVGAQIQLRRQGRLFVGLCPWHDDSKPSLQVNPERQTWKCWVCDLGGDIFSFVMQREGVDFREALQMLADRAGIPLDLNRALPAGQEGTRDDKNTLYRVMQWAADQFHQYLLRSKEAAVAREYLRKRQVTDESIETFHIGFAPPGWSWLLKRSRETPFSTDVLEAVGLAFRSERKAEWFDRFRGRIIFPIRDTQRRPIGMGGRILPNLADEKSAKYINSPETRLFSKSEQLYGFDLARDAVSQLQDIVIMEGYTDVIVARQHGIQNAVAVLGTALGERHIQLIKRFSRRATLVLDGDAAGQRRANEILDLFAASPVEARIVTLPQGQDPCDFLLDHGHQAFEELLNDACDVWDHKIRIETRGVDLIRDTHRANQALESLISALARSRKRQTSSASGAILDRQVLNRLAREFRVDESDLSDRLLEARQNLRQHRRPTPAVEQVTRKKKQPLKPFEHELFELLLLQPDLALPAVDALKVEDFETATAKEIFKMYEQLVRQHVTADLSRLLLEFDDAETKNLLAECDDTGQSKQDTDVEWDLQSILAAFHQRQAEIELQKDQASLEADDLTVEQEKELLAKFFDKKRELID